MLDNDLFQLGHGDRVARFDHFLRPFQADPVSALGIFSVAFKNRVDDKGFKQNQRHFPRYPALIHLKVGTDDDNAPAGVIDALTEKVLPEAALLSAQKVGQGLKRPVSLHDHLLVSLAVVNQGVDRLLKHPFLVFRNQARGALLVLFLQTVIAV